MASTTNTGAICTLRHHALRGPLDGRRPTRLRGQTLAVFTNDGWDVVTVGDHCLTVTATGNTLPFDAPLQFIVLSDCPL